MTNNISNLIASQTPEVLRGSAPLFVAFLETYYQYTQARQNAIGVIQNAAADVDIDLTLDGYISKFYSMYGEYLPQAMSLDRRHFLKLLNAVYEAKGTTKSLKLIFKGLFNEEIAISLPSEQMFRASDGIWEIENFFTLHTVYGTAPTSAVNLSFSNSTGAYNLAISKVIEVGTGKNRFYFTSYNNIQFDNDQQVFQYDAAGTLLYAGRLEKSPSKLQVVTAGKFWQNGKIIVIPGTELDSLARVTSITPTGGVGSVEILQHGYAHVENQNLTISPFPNKPTSSVFDVTSTLIGTNPTAYHHSISITDYIYNVSESVTGVYSHLLSDLTYQDTVVISQLSSQLTTEQDVGDADFTIADWIDSNATFTYVFDNVAKTKGNYRNVQGQLSNQEIRIQDSYFYQMFSYLVESKRDINEYRNVMNITHAAGTKRFSTLVKEVDYEFAFDSTSRMSLDTIYLLDIFSLIDECSKTFEKSLLDSADTISAIEYKTFDKAGLVDIADPISAIDYKNFDKQLVDTSAPTEAIEYKTFDKAGLVDTATSTESIDYKTFDKAGLEDTLAPTEAIDYKNFDKAGLEDSVSAVSLEDAVYTISDGYFTESYSPAYTTTNALLVIG